ncbi:MAG: hypothetical protein LC745_11305, partial [Planctomycetia bacterium]|nr:hypothetical protein [Planctomycetia bacterium]
ATAEVVVAFLILVAVVNVVLVAEVEFAVEIVLVGHDGLGAAGQQGLRLAGGRGVELVVFEVGVEVLGGRRPGRLAGQTRALSLASTPATATATAGPVELAAGPRGLVQTGLAAGFEVGLCLGLGAEFGPVEWTAGGLGAERRLGSSGSLPAGYISRFTCPVVGGLPFSFAVTFSDRLGLDGPPPVTLGRAEPFDLGLDGARFARPDDLGLARPENLGLARPDDLGLARPDDFGLDGV